MLGFVLVATVLGPPGSSRQTLRRTRGCKPKSATIPAATISISFVRGGRNGHAYSSDFSGGAPPQVIPAGPRSGRQRFTARLTCGVLGFSTQAFYKWQANPICERDGDDADLTNAIVASTATIPSWVTALSPMSSNERDTMSVRDGCSGCAGSTGSGPPRPRRAARAAPRPPALRSTTIWSTVTSVPRPRTSPGSPTSPNTPQRRGSYCCAIKDCFSNRIVGYSINERMTADLATAALRSPVARRQPRGTVVVHSDRGGQFRSRKFRAVLKANTLAGSMGRVSSAGERGDGIVLFLVAEERPQPAELENPQ